ncbi:hypothetical protein KI126_002609 [Enterococcus faecium]|nr:hypothetical protein [Enterococcus faecium]
MNNKKTGKIIRILSDEELLINIGKKQGAYVGEKYKIYEKGETIQDPDTGENLGTLDYIKATVEIVNVYENFSIVESLTRYKEKVSTGIMSAFSDKSREIDRVEVNKLFVEETEIKKRSIKNEHIIVGDLVESI